MLFRSQGGPIDYGTHVSGPVSQSRSDSEYNEACTEGMDLAYFRMLIHELLNTDPDIVPEEDPITIMDIKSSVCIDNIGKYTKHTRHFSRRVHFVRNDEKYKMQDIDWC